MLNDLIKDLLSALAALDLSLFCSESAPIDQGVDLYNPL